MFSKRIFFIVISLLVIFSALFSCGKRTGCARLNQEIISKLDDEKLDKSEFYQLINEINENITAFKICDFIDSNKIDTAKFYNYISELLKDNPKYSQAKIYNPSSDVVRHYVVNFFIENSASMFGYVEGNTKFEAILYDLIVLLRNSEKLIDTVNVYFINDNIYPIPKKFKESVEDFISDLTPEKMRIGNISTTNLNNILKLILSKHSKNNISILVSDCIYSISGKDTKGLLYKEEFATKDAFLKKLKELPLNSIILQYFSQFTGYYYTKDNAAVYFNKVERPFYIWFLVQDNIYPVFKTEVLNQLVKDFKYENALFLGKNPNLLIDYRILSNSYSIGTFTAEDSKIEIIKESRSKEDSNKFQFSIAVAIDTTSLLYNRNIFTDKNFELTADDNFNFTILPFDFQQIEHNDKIDLKSNAKKFNYILIIGSKKLLIPNQKIYITLKRTFPSWIKEYSTEDDSNIGKNRSLQKKTFGFEYLIDGVWGAYEKHYKDTLYNLIDLTIEINKK